LTEPNPKWHSKGQRT